MITRPTARVVHTSSSVVANAQRTGRVGMARVAAASFLGGEVTAAEVLLGRGVSPSDTYRPCPICGISERPVEQRACGEPCV